MRSSRGSTVSTNSIVCGIFRDFFRNFGCYSPVSDMNIYLGITINGQPPRYIEIIHQLNIRISVSVTRANDIDTGGRRSGSYFQGLKSHREVSISCVLCEGLWSIWPSTLRRTNRPHIVNVVEQKAVCGWSIQSSDSCSHRSGGIIVQRVIRPNGKPHWSPTHGALRRYGA
jgi:hypothetical protein